MPEAQSGSGSVQPSSGAATSSGGMSRADRLYENEEIILKAKMLEVEFVDTIIVAIEGESLSRRCKLALIAVICMGFDKNAVLANNQDLEIRILRFQEVLNKAKLSYSRPDVMNPAIVWIHEAILQAFRDFISRSYMMGERRMQGEKKVVSVYNTPESDAAAAQAQQQQQRNHGFNIREKIGMG